MAASTLLVRRPSTADNGRELVTSVHDVTKSVLRRVHPSLDAEGITMGQFWALHLVSAFRSTSLSAVARHLSVSAPTVCGNIDQLVSAGLVERRRSDRDRRAVELTLTPRGRKVEARIWARMGEVMAQAIADLPPKDVATTARVFRELQQWFEEHEGVVEEAA